MIAVDTNLLVYAHRRDSPWNAAAERTVAGLAESRDAWAIPWPCVHEFLGVVTHPRVFNPPTTLERALQQVGFWLESPSLVLLSEDEGYWEVFRTVVRKSRAAGPRVHDARIAALCRLHGVRELWSADRDFSRFAGLMVRNPLVG